MNKNVGLWVLLAVVGYASFLVLHTYWQYIFFAVLFAIIFAPLSSKLSQAIGKTTAAIVVTVAIILLLVIPTLYLVSVTIMQAPSAYQSVITAFEKESVRSLLGVTADEVKVFAVALGEKLRQNVLTNAGAYLNQISNVLIGLVVMFMTLFFLVRDGPALVKYLVRTAPLRKNHSENFVIEMRKMINAVILGQLVTALVQGILVGMLFWVLGLPNPTFWAFIATLLSIIPILGPLVVYVPAGIYLFVQERYIAGAVMILLGVLLISQIDNVIRPYVTARTAQVHALIPILGAIGGLKVWGFVGFIMGPLVLAAFVTVYKFLTRDNGSTPQK